MNKKSIQDIAKVLVEKYGLETKEAEIFVDAMFDTIKEGVEHEGIVKIKGFGTFKIIGVEARESVNVNTGERVMIESHGKITFTPDSMMKELVNKPFSQFETVLLNDGIVFDDIDNSKQSNTNNHEATIEDALKEVLSQEDKSMLSIDETEAYPINDKESESNETVAGNPEYAKDSVVEEAYTGIPKAELLVDTSTDGSALPEEISMTESLSDTPNEIPPDYFAEKRETSKANDKWKWGLFFSFSVAIMGLAAYAGYLYGLHTAKEMSDAHPQTEHKVKEVRKRGVVKEEKEDSSKIAKTDATEPLTEDNKVKAKENALNNTDTTDFARYEKMDARVRTGAYRITGTEREWTVRKGETLECIAHKILGEGMSCYVEVYNGLNRDSELKEGQTIRIPKLELKKKRRSK